MAYADFDLKTAVRTFGLAEDRKLDLFADVEPIEPDAFLRVWLDQFAQVALGFGSEKGRSEFVIAPMLVAARLRVGEGINILSGVPFDVDRARGLTGVCDFLLARSEEIFYLVGPVFAVVEAKREDILGGLGQCAAEMVAVQVFNEREGTVVSAIYGCVTSGNIWRFLKLEGSTLRIDRTEYYLDNAAKILGILVSIVRG